MARQFSRTVTNPKAFKSLMDQVWSEAWGRVKTAPFVITITQVTKSREQEKKYHSQIKDIHQQAFRGHSYEAIKALCVSWYAKEKVLLGEPLKNPGEKVWDWVNDEFVYIRPSTKKFSVKEGSDFIEFLYSFGAEHDIKWSEPVPGEYMEYREMRDE